MNTNTDKLVQALNEIHSLAGGEPHEYRQIALAALAEHDALAAQAEQRATADENDAILREVGRQMVAMTTTVRGPDEWLAIPELWRMCLEERDALRAAAPKQADQRAGGVDCIGLALDLEARAKTVESNTTRRAMQAAAHGLRLLAAPTGQDKADAELLDWLSRAGSVSIYMLQDQPGDGEIVCDTDIGSGQASTFRDAIRAARAKEQP